MEGGGGILLCPPLEGGRSEAVSGDGLLRGPVDEPTGNGFNQSLNQSYTKRKTRSAQRNPPTSMNYLVKLQVQ